MRFDPTAAAEWMSGCKVDEDANTLMLSNALHQLDVESPRELVRAARDSYYNMKALEFHLVAQRLGFRSIGRELVASDGCWLFWRAYWRTPGQLLLCEYGHWDDEPEAWFLNKATLYYNWHPSAELYGDSEAYRCTSTGRFYGSWVHPLWAGMHDCRTGFVELLSRLDRNGRFIEPWAYTPPLWAVVGRIEETRWRGRYHECTCARLREQLPSEIQGLINLEEFELLTSA